MLLYQFSYFLIGLTNSFPDLIVDVALLHASWLLQDQGLHYLSGPTYQLNVVTTYEYQSKIFQSEPERLKQTVRFSINTPIKKSTGLVFKKKKIHW